MSISLDPSMASGFHPVIIPLSLHEAVEARAPSHTLPAYAYNNHNEDAQSIPATHHQIDEDEQTHEPSDHDTYEDAQEGDSSSSSSSDIPFHPETRDTNTNSRYTRRPVINERAPSTLTSRRRRFQRLKFFRQPRNIPLITRRLQRLLHHYLGLKIPRWRPCSVPLSIDEAAHEAQQAALIDSIKPEDVEAEPWVWYGWRANWLATVEERGVKVLDTVHEECAETKDEEQEREVGPRGERAASCDPERRISRAEFNHGNDHDPALHDDKPATASPPLHPEAEAEAETHTYSLHHLRSALSIHDLFSPDQDTDTTSPFTTPAQTPDRRPSHPQVEAMPPIDATDHLLDTAAGMDAQFPTPQGQGEDPIQTAQAHRMRLELHGIVTRDFALDRGAGSASGTGSGSGEAIVKSARRKYHEQMAEGAGKRMEKEKERITCLALLAAGGLDGAHAAKAPGDGADGAKTFGKGRAAGNGAGMQKPTRSKLGSRLVSRWRRLAC
ncbi:MAG: hypothetical protein M1828_005464 [Chrysothrix sp. TS-e1954]|nr:MAG: hypothetical protein M1828_005464 [Chrysothrix sp. TS-e1954]